MKKAAEILARLLERGPAGALPYPSLFGGWQEIVGASLAEHCRAYEVRHHSLLVEADHPGWMQLLLLQKKAILGKLRQRFPELELRDIKVQVRPTNAPVTAEARRGPPNPAGAGVGGALGASAEAEQALAAVSDPELKEKLRLLLRELQMRGSGQGARAPRPQPK